MERYFVKAPVSGWREVGRAQFERFIDNIRKRATPPGMSIDDLIKSRTKVINPTEQE